MRISIFALNLMDKNCEQVVNGKKFHGLFLEDGKIYTTSFPERHLTGVLPLYKSIVFWEFFSRQSYMDVCFVSIVCGFSYG